MFEHNGITVPNWACRMWGLLDTFEEISSRKDPRSKILITFQEKTYEGWVTNAIHGRSTPAIRLWYQQELTLELKHAFLVSYMRSLEQRLTIEGADEIEKRIHFWEFLDIEYDIEERVFRFVAYYTQEPCFPNLFGRLIESPGLKKIDDELAEKDTRRIYKQDWRTRDQLPYEIGANNVLYTLLDTVNKLVYLREARELISRLNQSHPSIPHWNYYRYNVLPGDLDIYRVTLERMLIRDFAGTLPNKKNVLSLDISGYKLAIDKIDI